MFIHLLADEFTNHNEVPLGQKTIKLLNRLGYGVEIPTDIISGRSYISKGMLVEAKALANSNVEKLQALSPLNILTRGYSITMKAKQFESDKATVIVSAEVLALGDLLCTRLHNGTIISEVKKIEP